MTAQDAATPGTVLSGLGKLNKSPHRSASCTTEQMHVRTLMSLASMSCGRWSHCRFKKPCKQEEYLQQVTFLLIYKHFFPLILQIYKCLCKCSEQHLLHFSVSLLILHMSWAVEQLFHSSRFTYQPISTNNTQGKST